MTQGVRSVGGPPPCGRINVLPRDTRLPPGPTPPLVSSPSVGTQCRLHSDLPPSIDHPFRVPVRPQSFSGPSVLPDDPSPPQSVVSSSCPPLLPRTYGARGRPADLLLPDPPGGLVGRPTSPEPTGPLPGKTQPSSLLYPYPNRLSAEGYRVAPPEVETGPGRRV